MMKPAPKRLPVELVIRRSYLYAWESRAVLMTPLVIYAVVTMLADIVLGGLLGAVGRPIQFLVAAAEQVFAMGFAVGVHRFVLAGEARRGLAFFRWDRHFIRYLLLSFLLLLLALVAVGMVMLAAGNGPGTEAVRVDGATALFGTAALFVVSLVIARLSLLLPAAAVGEEVPARTIWQASEGNGFRLLATGFLTVLPFIGLEMMLIGLKDSMQPFIVVTILLSLVTSAQLIVLTIMLALSYDVLVRGGGPSAP
jgi:hypothetical protein